jgi:hypothetical protein
MPLDAAAILGVLGALVGVADSLPYLRDILRGSTRPHRGTWLIWSLLAILAYSAQRADGASWSVALTATQAVFTGLIFALGIRRGEGGLGGADLALIAIALAGVAGWIVAREPVVAVACVIVADLSATAMMLPKAYRDPGSETLSTFALASVAGALAAGAVGDLDVSLLLYPVYYCLANASVALLLHVRRGVARTCP